MRTVSTLLLVALPCGVSTTSAQTPLTTVRVATGLSRPLDVQAPPGDRHRIFIVEQGGAIRIVKDGQLLATPFISFSSSQVLCCGERGLLGLAFHPDYATNGYFFVNYTNSSGATMVERYTVSSSNPATLRGAAKPGKAMVTATNNATVKAPNARSRRADSEARDHDRIQE